MISLIKGKIININKNTITVETSGGVGYEIFITPLFLSEIKMSEMISVHTYLKVAEGVMDLYGFQNKEQKEFFELLISVSGVGPKTAINILAIGSIDEIQAAIGRSDVKYLTGVSGIGKKTAERMVVELKSKIKSQKSKVEDGEQSNTASEVVDGLIALGYSKEEARSVIQKLDIKGKNTGELMREALKNIK